MTARLPENLVILFVVVAGCIASGVDAAAEIKCNPDGAQNQINVCAAQDAESADRELNEVYRAVLRKEGEDGGFIAKLRVSQRAWIAYRDAELSATYACTDPDSRQCWGSMYPMCYASYKALLTRERSARLKKYLDEGREYCP